MATYDRIHPHAVAARANFHPDIVQEVAAAVAKNKVVVVGMAWNPSCKKARVGFEKDGVPCTYLEYGNYLTGWRRRLALKMWVGWPTFPMVFVNGQFVGGASDTETLRASGELKRILAA